MSTPNWSVLLRVTTNTSNTPIHAKILFCCSTANIARPLTTAFIDELKVLIVNSRYTAYSGAIGEVMLFQYETILTQTTRVFTTNQLQLPGVGVPGDNAAFLSYIDTYDATSANTVAKMNAFHNYGARITYVLIPISSISTYSAILESKHPMLI